MYFMFKVTPCYQKLLPFSFANKVAPHCTKKWPRRRERKKYNKSVRTRLFWSHNCRTDWLKQENKKETFEKTARTGVGKNSGRKNTGERNERKLFGLFLVRFDFDFWCFNATFSNISAISWRPVLVVEEAGVPGENHRPWASNW